MEARQQEVKAFLQRPIILTTFDWSITSNTNDILYTVDAPASLLTNPMYAAKLDGYMGFRAGVKLRVQVNSQRFQQGRLLIHYLPQTDLLGLRVTTANMNLTTKTQQPRVDLDISTQTDAVLEMPYTSPAIFYNLLDGTGKSGSFYITNYSPLMSPSGTTAVSVTVWVSFFDIELMIPTLPYSTYYPQMAGSSVKSKNVVEFEQLISETSSLSSFFRGASRMLGTISNAPFLSTIAKPLSWVAAAASGVAYAFGYSNPVDASTTHRFVQDQFAYSNNCNAADESHKLGLFADNGVDVLPGFGNTDVDEMSIQHLVKVAAYVGTVEWTLIQIPDTLIWSQKLGPDQMWQSIAGIGRTYAPMGYLANYFSFWRGSINFCFKFVKTEFHSGRLLFAFFPGLNTLPASFSTYDLDHVYREIIDVRTSTEFTVRVPYTCNKPYQQTGVSCGYVALFVLNELRAPPTVANFIQILVETYGGDDMEFEVPCPPPRVPMLYYPGYVPPAGPMEPQMETSAANNNSATTSRDVGQAASISIMPSGMAPARYCIGERINSVLQLMKRAAIYNFDCVTDTVSNALIYRPFLVNIGVVNNVLEFPPQLGYSVDYVSAFSGLYVFRRGGVRFHFASPWNGDNTGQWRVWLLNSSSKPPPGSLTYSLSTVLKTFASPDWEIAPTVFAKEACQGGIQYETPQYMSVPSAVIRPSVPENPEPVDAFASGAQIDVVSTTAFNGYRLYRQAAEDYQLGFFIGVLPLGVPATRTGAPI